MQHADLENRIARGRGTAARHIGAAYDAFRPTGWDDPVAPANRFLRLPAAFSAEDTAFKRPAGYGHATWLGLFDNAYTQAGDYLRGPGGTFFIAAQQALTPPLCVLTNRVVTVSRPGAPATEGLNGYGGTLLAQVTVLLSAWPAAVLTAGAGMAGDLPGDGTVASWTILLPQTGVRLRAADLVQDDLGRTYVIGSAETTALGWRMVAKQAAT